MINANERAATAPTVTALNSPALAGGTNTNPVEELTMQADTTSAPVGAIPLNTRDEVQHAVENAWATLQTARNAMHFLLRESESDWTMAIEEKRQGRSVHGISCKLAHSIDSVSGRAWLAELAWSAVNDADDALSYIINNIPDEVKSNG